MHDLNKPLRELAAASLPEMPTLTPEIFPGLKLHLDPAARIDLRHASPRGRLLELAVVTHAPGDWLGLHLSLHLPDLTQTPWVGFALRAAAEVPILLRACLRSGLAEGGFHDQFFDRHILVQPGATDHHDLLAPQHFPELPLVSGWRELIFFLPSAQNYRLSLQELRVFAP